MVDDKVIAVPLAAAVVPNASEPVANSGLMYENKLAEPNCRAKITVTASCAPVPVGTVHVSVVWAVTTATLLQSLEPILTVGITDPSPKLEPEIVIGVELEYGQLTSAFPEAWHPFDAVVEMLVTTGAE